MSFEAIAVSLATKIGRALVKWAWRKQVSVSRAELERRRHEQARVGDGVGLDRTGGTMRVRGTPDLGAPERVVDRPGERGGAIGCDRSRDELREAMSAARIALREDGR